MRLRLAFCGLLVAGGTAVAEPPAAEQAAAEQPAGPATESVHAALCRLIESAAREHGVAADFLTKLIWAESSFRARAVSPKGAQGIAQFMPGTAAERGLADPFDPEQAIAHAASLIADLSGRFGNLGLAAAAYNAGPARVEKWLAKETSLPAETRNFVLRVTGRSAEDWAAKARGEAGSGESAGAPTSCGAIVASLRWPGAAGEPTKAEGTEESPFAPWGVQVAGNFSKDRALAAFARVRQRWAGAIGDVRPMVIGTRLLNRGSSTFYRVRLPANSRADADGLCRKIHAAGGACVVLRS